MRDIFSNRYFHIYFVLKEKYYKMGVQIVKTDASWEAKISFSRLGICFPTDISIYILFSQKNIIRYCQGVCYVCTTLLKQSKCLGVEGLVILAVRGLLSSLGLNKIAPISSYLKCFSQG
jgi:hypothetical protein